MAVRVREKVKGSGEWWIFINHKGKRKAKRIGRDRKEAYEVAKKIEAKLVLGDLDIEKPISAYPTFKEYAGIWLETSIKTLRRRSTYERYKTALNKHVFPALGKVPINEIKRGQIRDLLLKLHNSGLSRSTICLIRDIISGPMEYAVDEELIQANPASGVLKRLNIKREKKDPVGTLNQDEVDLFLITCLEHFPEHYPFFMCAFRTGMRLGELLGLQWGDVDWNGMFIEVKRSYKLGRFNPPKNGKVRRVDMSDQLVGTLRDLLRRRKKEALKSGLGGVVETIFHRNGNPMEQNYIRRVFKRILAKAGLREIRFHDIRHSFASLLLSNGESPVYVKEQLGHHSIQMTVDIYGHLIPSSNRGAVNKLDTQPSATYTQPAKKQEPQPVEVTAQTLPMVPKARLELAQAYAH